MLQGGPPGGGVQLADEKTLSGDVDRTLGVVLSLSIDEDNESEDEMTIKIQNGYIYAETTNGLKEVGKDLTFGIRNPRGARYRCKCGAHYNLPRHIAAHLASGNCTAI